jgi:ABC-type transporter Mla subunit MlaD
MKSLRRMFRAKRAFSAVIASLILMLLAVAAGVVVYAYVMGWIGGATQNPTHTGQMQFDSLHAYATSPNGTIKAYVRNVGGVELNVSQIYVEGVGVGNVTNTNGSINGTLAIQSVIYLEVNYNMTKNNFYEVAVACKDGTSVSQSVQAK